MTIATPVFPPGAGSQNCFSRRGILARAAAAGASLAAIGAAGAAVAAIAPDPVYAAIERHRATEAALVRASDEWDRVEGELAPAIELARTDPSYDPKDVAADAAMHLSISERIGLPASHARCDELMVAADVAAYAILDARPTTLDGVAALLRYAAETVERDYLWPDGVGANAGRGWCLARIHRMVADVLPEIVAGNAARAAGRAS